MLYVLFDCEEDDTLNPIDFYEELYELEDSVSDDELWDIAENIAANHNLTNSTTATWGWQKLTKDEAQEWYNNM